MWTKRKQENLYWDSVRSSLSIEKECTPCPNTIKERPLEQKLTQEGHTPLLSARSSRMCKVGERIDLRKS